MSRLRLRVLLIGTIALAATVGSVGPASSHATVSIESPAPGQELTTARSTVRALVAAGGHGPAGSSSISKVEMTVVAPEGDPITASATTRESGGAVAFPVTLSYNGRYQVSVTATWTHVGVVLGPDRGLDEDNETFTVNAPPVNPSGVKTVVDAASRAVTVSWAANPEPDMLFYVVQRAKGGSTEFAQVGGAIAHPTTQFVDATTAEAGGEYRYQVIAVRQSAVKDEGISSDPSALSPESTATVPDPPAPPATAGGPGTTVAAAPGSTLPANSPGALTTSGKVDLNGFTNVQSQARRSTPRTVPPRDTGFQGTLPFAAQPDQEEGEVEVGGELGELGADSPQFRELGEVDEAADRQRTMAFFAAGLLATVLLMHVLWVKSEVKRVPLEALAPEGHRPQAAQSPGVPGSIAPVTTKEAKLRRPVDRPDWFVPDRLGLNGSSGRPAQPPAPPQKVSSGS